MLDFIIILQQRRPLSEWDSYDPEGRKCEKFTGVAVSNVMLPSKTGVDPALHYK